MQVNHTTVYILTKFRNDTISSFKYIGLKNTVLEHFIESLKIKLFEVSRLRLRSDVINLCSTYFFHNIAAVLFYSHKKLSNAGIFFGNFNKMLKNSVLWSKFQYG